MVEKKDKGKREDFYSFEDVLKELNLNEMELKRMVSEGELRAFREEDHIKFRKEDIDTVKRGKITEPTVRLPTEELGVLPKDIAQDETFVEDTSSLTDEMSFTDTDITVPTIEEEKHPEAEWEKEKTFIEEETGMVTTPLGGEIEPGETVVEETIPETGETVTEEFAETVVEKPPALRPPAHPSAVRPRPSRIQPMAIPIPKPRVHPIFIIILGFTFFVMLFVGSLLSDTFRISTGKAKFPVGITRELGKMVISIFGIKDKTGNRINLDNYIP